MLILPHIFATALYVASPQPLDESWVAHTASGQHMRSLKTSSLDDPRSISARDIWNAYLSAIALRPGREMINGIEKAFKTQFEVVRQARDGTVVHSASLANTDVWVVQGSAPDLERGPTTIWLSYHVPIAQLNCVSTTTLDRHLIGLGWKEGITTSIPKLFREYVKGPSRLQITQNTDDCVVRAVTFIF